MKATSLRSILVVPVLFCASLASTAKPAELRLLDHIASDPLIVMAAGETSFDEVYQGWMEMLGRFGSDETRVMAESGLAEWEQKVGCSVRDELLARIGPEYAVVLDLPPVDRLMEAMSGGPRAAGGVLTNLGILATVNEPESLDGCLRKVLGFAEASIVEEDGLVRADLGPPGEAPFSIYYGFKGDIFALGVSPAFVRASLEPRSVGQRLVDGRDFSAVFKHLDRRATTLSYLNLPKAREMVNESAFLQGMIDRDPESSRIIRALMAPEYSGTGMGTTAVKVEGGVRTTYFASSGISQSIGGTAITGIVAAIAIPNFLNAIDRGKQKRTMADIRSAATAMEAYAVDNNAYPGPTDGWVPLAELTEWLSPIYIRQLPDVDGWGNTMLAWSDGEHYRIVSPGKDGELERDWSGDLGDGAATSLYTADIVFFDGQFIAWPEGPQQ
jgi:general secretion pathway protein G